MKKRNVSVSVIIIYTVLSLGAVLCLTPILNIIAISLSENAAAATGTVYFIPKMFTTASYIKLLAEGAFGRSFMISALRVVVGAGLSLPVMLMMAYALSKDQRVFRERNVIMWVCVLTMLFNGGLIPTYIVVQRYGLINSFWALILPMVMNVYNMIILMNYFRGVPRELEEAAAIDGASAWRTLWTVYLPISLPSIATITLFTVVNHWNDFFAGLIYINSPDNYPLQTYIRSLTIQIDYTTITNPKDLVERLKVSSITFNAAKIVVSMIPIVCIYPFLQRYFVSGLVMGSVKE